MTQLEAYLETKTHIVWDWNGTLLDDVDLCVSTMTAILEKYGLTAIDKAAYRKCFSFPVIDYYKGLGFDFEAVSFEKVGDEWMALYQKNLHAARLHPGVPDFLAQMRSKQKSQSILSAAKETHLIDQLKHFGISDFFDYVYGISDHYAKGKVERGKELLESLNVDCENILLIGDTDHDVEVGHALGIEVLLVGDGHQEPERFESLKARVVKSRL